MDAYIQIVKELAAGGFATFLVTILVAGRYRLWMWGYQYDEMLKEKNAQYMALQEEKNAQIEYERKRGDKWEALAMDFKSQVARTIEVASKAVGA